MPTISSNLPEVEYEIIVKERRKVRKSNREWAATGTPAKPVMDYTPPLDTEVLEEREVFSITQLADPRMSLLSVLSTTGRVDQALKIDRARLGE